MNMPMSKRMLGWFVTVVMALTVTVATAQEFGGTLRVASKAEPETLDQMWSTSDLIYWITANIYEGLYTYNSNFEPELQLAERHDISDDALVHTFHLRQGVMFHNGKEMGAEDVVASVSRWMDRSPLGRIIAENTVELAAVDQYTVRWTLSAPVAPLTFALAIWSQGPVIYPSEVIEAAGSEQMITDYIGTGPFKFEEWQRGSMVRLSRFEGYQPVDREPDGSAGRRTAYLDEIVYQFIPETSVRLIGVVADDFDYAIEVDREGVLPYLDDPAVQVLRSKNGTAILALNHANPLMSDVRIRRAMQAGLCVEDILQVYSSDQFYDIEPSVTGRGAWYTDVGAEVYDQCDPEKARSLAQEAGYDGEPIRVLLSTGSQAKFDMSLVIQQQLAQAGLNFEILELDSAAYGVARRDNTAYELLFNESSRRPHPMLHSHLPSTGLSNWVNEEKEGLIDELFAATTQEDAFAVWERIEELWYQDVVTVKIGDFFNVNVARADVKGLVQFDWPFFWNVWLE